FRRVLFRSETRLSPGRDRESHLTASRSVLWASSSAAAKHLAGRTSSRPQRNHACLRLSDFRTWNSFWGFLKRQANAAPGPTGDRLNALGSESVRGSPEDDTVCRMQNPPEAEGLEIVMGRRKKDKVELVPERPPGVLSVTRTG